MTAVNIQPIYDTVINPFIVDLLQGFALAIVSWITFIIQKYAPQFLEGYLESKASKDLNTALQNGVVIAMHKIEGAEALHSNVEVKGLVTRLAAQYAISHVPGAVKRFNLDPGTLATKALAYIPVPPTTTDLTSSSKTTKTVSVEVTNLGPVAP